ncbi:acyl-[acyl-carrier-protein]--UDP-N-acetylglucosamine O-acyltransferase [Candidatus Poribacteria bacterium]|nr:MAG: acyl-[acyl-carrier-protein]--UDP-N-acetylglucosamine O-acyltransferase [Candidatus Poribacteria bacterium]
MVKIHPTAIVHPKAELDEDVEVGPYSIIEEDVQIGRGTKIGPHVLICRWTRIGRDCRIHFGSTIGVPSQDLKYKGWRSYAIIGDRNVIREYVSISRATAEEGATIIGNDNLIMNSAKISHDCVIGNNVIMADFATLGGHVQVEDYARVGAMTGVHQFVRIGKMAMAGACSKFTKDVPPFTVADGHPARVRGLNIIGLSTSVANPMKLLPPETRARLKKAFRILFRSDLPLKEAIERVRREVEPDPEVEHLLRFIETSKRGICV